MNELAQFCKELKTSFKPRLKDPRRPVRFWTESDFLNGKIVDTFVIILKTRGCSWAHNSGCAMCGYFNDTMWFDISSKDLETQFENAMNDYSGQKFVKIFTSGSFLDKKEIKKVVQDKILKYLVEKADKISIESRPEYIIDSRLKGIKSKIDSCIFEIGIGLETANDFIRKNCLNKGFTFNKYLKAVEIIKKYDFKIKTYLLIKPPFITEKKSIDDSLDSMEKIKNLTDTISFNPTNVQNNTLVNYLWSQRKYRPPWLFSVVEILKESKRIANNVKIKCDISGGGNIRGAHNCGSCDKKFLYAISKFSLSQNTNDLKNLDCECREKWLDQLDIEELGFGSLSNMYK
jgi:radical SAM enzyme (TIGR01210 family)